MVENKLNLAIIQGMNSYVTKEKNDLKDLCVEVREITQDTGRDFDAILAVLAYVERRREIMHMAQILVEDTLIQAVMGGDVQNSTVN